MRIMDESEVAAIVDALALTEASPREVVERVVRATAGYGRHQTRLVLDLLGTGEIPPTEAEAHQLAADVVAGTTSPSLPKVYPCRRRAAAARIAYYAHWRAACLADGLTLPDVEVVCTLLDRTYGSTHVVWSPGELLCVESRPVVAADDRWVCKIHLSSADAGMRSTSIAERRIEFPRADTIVELVTELLPEIHAAADSARGTLADWVY
jgi:hypothetical protein